MRSISEPTRDFPARVAGVWNICPNSPWTSETAGTTQPIRYGADSNPTLVSHPFQGGFADGSQRPLYAFNDPGQMPVTPVRDNDGSLASRI